MLSSKVYFILSVSFSCLLSCSTAYNEQPDYSLTIKQTGRLIRSWGDMYNLTFQLVPKRDSLAGLFLMTCSWSDHSLTSDSDLFVHPPACDANYMIHRIIPSGQFLELYSPIRHKKGFELINRKIRVAFIVIDSLDFTWSDYMSWDRGYASNFIDSLKEQKHRYVWSNEIKLRDMKEGNSKMSGWELMPIASISSESPL